MGRTERTRKKFISKGINKFAVFVALNKSGKNIEEPLSNFHSGGNDRRLENAVKDGPFDRCWITDIFKHNTTSNGVELAAILKKDPNIEIESIEELKEEFEDFDITESHIIAIGRKSEKYLKKHFKRKIHYIPHYTAHGTIGTEENIRIHLDKIKNEIEN